MSNKNKNNPDTESTGGNPDKRVPTFDTGVIDLGKGMENEELGEARWILQRDGREVADLVETANGFQLVQIEGGPPIVHPTAPAKPAKSVTDPFAGAIPMELLVSGTPWANNARRLIRVAPSGELADSWLVDVGGQLVLNDGRQTLPATPYHHLSPKLQARARWDSLDQALDAARSFVPR